MSDCIEFEAAPQKSIFGAVKTYFKNRAENRKSRAAFQYLFTLDPHILKDIGLNQGDVVWANNLPIEVDAARALEKEVRHRKHLV